MYGLIGKSCLSSLNQELKAPQKLILVHPVCFAVLADQSFVVEFNILLDLPSFACIKKNKSL